MKTKATCRTLILLCISQSGLFGLQCKLYAQSCPTPLIGGCYCKATTPDLLASAASTINTACDASYNSGTGHRIAVMTWDGLPGQVRWDDDLGSGISSLSLTTGYSDPDIVIYDDGTDQWVAIIYLDGCCDVMLVVYRYLLGFGLAAAPAHGPTKVNNNTAFLCNSVVPCNSPNMDIERSYTLVGGGFVKGGILVFTWARSNYIVANSIDLDGFQYCYVDIITGLPLEQQISVQNPSFPDVTINTNGNKQVIFTYIARWNATQRVDLQIKAWDLSAFDWSVSGGPGPIIAPISFSYTGLYFVSQGASLDWNMHTLGAPRIASPVYAPALYERDFEVVIQHDDGTSSLIEGFNHSEYNGGPLLQGPTQLNSCAGGSVLGCNESPAVAYVNDIIIASWTTSCNNVFRPDMDGKDIVARRLGILNPPFPFPPAAGTPLDNIYSIVNNNVSNDQFAISVSREHPVGLVGGEFNLYFFYDNTNVLYKRSLNTNVSLKRTSGDISEDGEAKLFTVNQDFFNDAIFITFDWVSSSGTIEIFDVQGRLLANMDISQLNEGRHTISVNDIYKAEELASGLYLIKLSSEMNSMTRKLLKQ